MADHDVPAMEEPTERNTEPAGGSGGNVDLSTPGTANLHDSVYEALRDNFLKRNGRGRRKALPHLAAVTNRVLAQLHLLKLEGSSTWEEVLTWFDKLFPAQSVTGGCLVKCIERAASKAEEEMDDILDFNSLSPSLKALGLTKNILLDGVASFHPVPGNPIDISEVLSNNVVYDLDIFRSKNGRPHAFVSNWLRRFLEFIDSSETEDILGLTDSKIKSKVQSIVKTVKNFQRKSARDELNTFFASSEFLKSKPVNHAENRSQSEKCQCSFDIKSLKKEILILQEKLNTSKERNECLSLQVDVLKEECQAAKKSKNFESELKCLKNEQKSQKAMNAELRQKLSDIKKKKFYKRNSYLNMRLKELRSKLLNKQKECETLKSVAERELAIKHIEISKLKKKIKVEQTLKARYKKKLTEISSLKTYLQNEKEEIKLREDKFNQCSDEIRLTCMSLLGEGNVAAQNCSKVIKIVSEHLFKKKLLKEDLPSASTILNFANEAYQIANHQVVENINNAEHITLATDGTSRQKKHYLERHIVLDSGKTMSLGFTEVANEDADTLLEKSIEILSDLSEIYCKSVDDTNHNNNSNETQETVFKEIMRKIKCLMSDRASVMKSFDSKLADYKKQVLGEEEDVSTHFLFCNAHFLLGLVRSTEDALKIIENDIGKLGRDLDSTFISFSKAKETAAFRLLRLAADVFGPRGDEKNGCREEWIAYCETKQKFSKFISHRTNRFNNVFENASAILYHREDMFEFLSDYSSNTNLKLKSILADLKDGKLISIIAAIALFHLNFTGPYWNLMNSDTSYGEFPKFVDEMKQCLNEWSNLEFDFQTQNLTPVFGNKFKVKEPHFNQLNHCEIESDIDMDVFKSAFVEIVNQSKTVLLRQLADFLEGGIFGGDIDVEILQILKTCPLTNLSGERLFGNLDFDINKRRHASTHLRSTINMGKINKTSKWIGKQKEVKVRKLLSNARKYGGTWKVRSQERQKDVRKKIKERIKENMEKKKAQENKKLQIKNNLLLEIIHQGGPCSSKEDLDVIMKGTNVKNNLKNQIKFRKFIMNEKALLTSGNIRQLHRTLCKSLGLDMETDILSPPKKKRRLEKF